MSVIKKKIFAIGTLCLVCIILIFLLTFAYKKLKFGNNESNKSAEEIEEYILNMNSYTAELEVTVNSNKNTSKYVLKQEYFSNNYSKQTVVKPENIEGTEIIYKDGNMVINNSKLNLNKVYNNYPYLSDNVLWLNFFVEEYKNCKDNAKVYEENNEVVIEISIDNNKYLTNEKLYLEQGTGKPKKIEISDDNKNTTVYILYKEININ